MSYSVLKWDFGAWFFIDLNLIVKVEDFILVVPVEFLTYLLSSNRTW